MYIDYTSGVVGEGASADDAVAAGVCYCDCSRVGDGVGGVIADAGAAGVLYIDHTSGVVGEGT